jgi:hypothetical protein
MVWSAGGPGLWMARMMSILFWLTILEKLLGTLLESIRFKRQLNFVQVAQEADIG